MDVIDIELDPEENEVTALSLIDAALGSVSHAAIVDAGYVRDLLLDLRQVIAPAPVVEA